MLSLLDVVLWFLRFDAGSKVKEFVRSPKNVKGMGVYQYLSIYPFVKIPLDRKHT
jgi:hypothetical protein